MVPWMRYLLPVNISFYTKTYWKLQTNLQFKSLKYSDYYTYHQILKKVKLFLFQKERIYVFVWFSE
jgi:hypothetical protein